MRYFPSFTTLQYRILAVLWTIGVVVACTLPAETLPQVESALSLDKLVHFSLFAGLGALWMRGLCPPARSGLGKCFRRRGVAVLLAGGGFAGGLEVYQHSIPLQRLGDPYDAVANGLGLLVALAAYYLYHERGVAAHSAQSEAPFTES